MSIAPHATTAEEFLRLGPNGRRYERYEASIDEYVHYHEKGYLIVRNLVPRDEIDEIIRHTEELMDGKVTVPKHDPPPPHLTKEERAQHYLRIHMLHRVLPLHERFLLHPRILDVLEALIGPDVRALQTMLFLKGPGQPGQGYHQDSYYIPTQPDTLCGAWLAVDRADEENGCLWITEGSQFEPIYPPPADDHGTPQRRLGEPQLKGLFGVSGVSATDEAQNDLTQVARKYQGRETKAEVEPGDVIFFGGHILHRSHANRSQDRFRRAFVGHYCNARSHVQWNGTMDMHILARGNTHLPFAQPAFGTPCAALLPAADRSRLVPDGSAMMGGADGNMEQRKAAES